MPGREFSNAKAMEPEQSKSFDIKTVREVLQQHADGFKATEPQPGQPEATILSIEQDEAMQQPIVGYKVLDKMGSGGMAVVFKAQNMASGQIVALKLLYPGREKDKTILRQFVNEGMMLIRLDHPNILKGIDFGISKGMYFLAIEYIRGESLDSFLEKGFHFTQEYTFDVALQIAKALAHLEEKGIVHRDIKPANILLMEDKVKLADFAFALDTTQMKDAHGRFDITCGTMEYLSPEQARGNKDIDGRSDVYSLGITCFHMITGKVPFSAEDRREIMRCHIYEPIPVQEITNISRSSRLLLERMVAKRREDRVRASRLVPMLEKLLRKLRNQQ